MTDTYEDLIRRLREYAKEMMGQTPPLCREAADAIAALVKERDERLTLHMEQLQIARTDSYSYGLRDGERIGLEKAAKDGVRFSEEPPCGCIEHRHDTWMQYCFCGNNGDLSNAEAWCTAANIRRDIRALIPDERQSDDDKV